MSPPLSTHRVLLALETATDVCAVALIQDGTVRAARSTDAPRAHAAQLAPFIAEVLAEARVTVTAIDAVAVSAGPGSFTGLRIGIATAKGLCLATGAALVLVPTLDALVEAARIDRIDGAAGAGMRVLAALPSRRGEVFVGGTGNAPRAVAISALADLVGGGPVVFIGAGAEAACDALPSGAATAIPTPASAVAVARLAAQRLSRGEADALDTAEPLYVQAFEPARRRA